MFLPGVLRGRVPGYQQWAAYGEVGMIEGWLVASAAVWVTTAVLLLAMLRVAARADSPADRAVVSARRTTASTAADLRRSVG
jgi:hypothetical protein